MIQDWENTKPEVCKNTYYSTDCVFYKNSLYGLFSQHLWVQQVTRHFGNSREKFQNVKVWSFSSLNG